MQYKVNNMTDFCRVFEVPEQFPNGFCFGGGFDITFKMVDWFSPLGGGLDSKGKEIELEELERELFSFLKNKLYVKPNRTYLVLYDFGASSLFTFKR
jgi:hypothetical protein